MALGIKEMLLIGLALLIFFGPSKLPELGKAMGKGIQEFKKASRELTDSAGDDPAGAPKGDKKEEKK